MVPTRINEMGSSSKSMSMVNMEELINLFFSCVLAAFKVTSMLKAYETSNGKSMLKRGHFHTLSI